MFNRFCQILLAQDPLIVNNLAFLHFGKSCVVILQWWEREEILLKKGKSFVLKSRCKLCRPRVTTGNSRSEDLLASYLDCREYQIVSFLCSFCYLSSLKWALDLSRVLSCCVLFAVAASRDIRLLKYTECIQSCFSKLAKLHVTVCIIQYTVYRGSLTHV